jgi:hypothetical protein
MNTRYLNISEVREIMQSDQRKFDEMVRELKFKEAGDPSRGEASRSGRPTVYLSSKPIEQITQ